MTYGLTHTPFNIMISLPIRNIYDGKRFIRCLVDKQLDYHLEDDASDIFYYHNVDGSKIEGGKRVFTNWQSKKLDRRVQELYELEWNQRIGGCPIGYMLDYEWIKGKLND